jgi:hypothetical protein
MIGDYRISAKPASVDDKLKSSRIYIMGIKRADKNIV